MRRIMLWLLALPGLMLVANGCILEPIPTPTPAPPDVSDWELVMADTFDDPDSGFGIRDYAHGRWFYEDGRYGIEVAKTNWLHHTAQGDFADFMLEVEVTAQAESGAGGVVFRFGGNEGLDHYYSFLIASNGQFALDKLVRGNAEKSEWQNLAPWQESPHLNRGRVTNHLRVIGVGPDLWLYANGHLLATVQDPSFATGSVGMVAETFPEETHALYLFDNLKVYAPPGQE